MDPTLALEPSDPRSGDDYLDTVALLQEEIERLEAELRAANDRLADPAPAPAEAEAGSGVERRLEELTALLDERDEAIALLCEHLSVVEEAQAARSAEWGQLQRWVEELELRLGESDHEPAESGPIGPSIPALQDEWEARPQRWDLERQQLEAELASLRDRLARQGAAEGPPDVASLEHENQQLRDECRRLSGYEAESARLADRVTLLQAQLETAREQMRASGDDLRAERLRHESELAELRARQAAQRLPSAEITPSERVRALREHLHEVHAREEQERRERQLSTRIARLLGRVGPPR